GNESFQLCQVAADGSGLRPLTAAPAVQHSLGPVAPDGRRVAYGANDREPSAQDVVVRDLDSDAIQRVYDAGGMVYPGRWSPDGTRLTVMELRGNTDHLVYVVPVDGGGAPERVLPLGEDEAVCVPGPWLADGTGFLVRSDAGRDHVGLARFDLATRSLDWLETPDWDVADVALSADGRILVWTVNVDGVSRLHARDLTTGEPVAVPELPAGVVADLSLSADGSRLALLVATATRPFNVGLLELSAQRFRWLTDARPVAATATAEPALVRFPTHDGRQVPAW